MQQRLKRLWEEIGPQITPYLTMGRISMMLGGLFLIVYATLGFLYVTESTSQTRMREDIARLSRSTSASAGRAQEVDAEYRRVQEAIPPGDLTETDVFETILQLASEIGVTPQISYSQETAETIGGQAYRVLKFQVTAAGPAEAVLDFFRALDKEQTLLETLVVQSVSLSTGGTGTTRMAFSVYTLPGQ